MSLYLEGRPCIGIEQDAESVAVAVARCRHALRQRARMLPFDVPSKPPQPPRKRRSKGVRR